MVDTVNLLCTRERLGETVTQLQASPVPEGQIVGESYTPPEGCEVASGWDVVSGQFGTLGAELLTETGNVLASSFGAIPYIVGYVLLILLAMFTWRAVKSFLTPKRDFTSLKTVTFGDESAVRSEFAASVISVVFIFVIWGTFTGSALLPSFLHLPAPFTGENSFTYTAMDADGNRDDATVFVRVFEAGADPDEVEVAPGDGFAKDDTVDVTEYRSEIVTWDRNDDVNRRDDGARIVAINGQEFDFDASAEDSGTPPSFELGWARVAITERGTINVSPDVGWQDATALSASAGSGVEPVY